MIAGVIFDLDGTITLTEEYHHRAFAEVFRRFGIEYSLEEHAARFAAAGATITFGTVFRERGKKMSDAEMAVLKEEKAELYKKIIHDNEVNVVTGVEEFVRRIDAAGLKKIIATGNSHLDIVRIILKKVGLLEFFPLMVSASEVEHGKPHPDIFLEAARRIGCEPSVCVVLEDSVNGAAAAKAAGMRCIVFDTTAKKEDLLKAGAHVVLHNYHELTDDILYGRLS